jgi:two-component system cell cycle sensor histidine kinase/response regulator CckA
VVCEVTDTGTGMTREVMEKMFEPFFSTKEVGKGTGLGLSTVYGIVKQTGGYIFCDSSIGKGTTFRIYLPRHQEQAAVPQIAAKAEKKERAKDLTGSGTVLLVEDEEAVRRFAVRALTRQGYNVLEAGSGAEALDVIAAHDGTIDLVLSDVVMPEMDGPTLLKELRKTHPDLKIIFISGYAEEALKSLEGGEEFAFLPKPFQMAELVATVKEVMQR